MTRFRVLTAAALVAGLSLAAGVFAQPPNLIPVKGQPKNLLPVQPKLLPLPGQPQVVGGAAAELPVVPKSSAAFLSLKLSDVLDHPDLKPALEQLKKNPEAFEGFGEILGVAPSDIERLTLFWPAIGSRYPGEPVVVVTTRQPYNEVRVLKTLRAEPVFDDDHRRGDFRPEPGFGGGAKSVGSAKSGDFPPPPPPIFKEPKGGGAPPPIKGPPPGAPDKQNLDEDGSTVPIAAAAPPEPLFYEVRGGAFGMLILADERTLVFVADGPRSQFNMVALFAQTLQKKQGGPLAEAIAGAGGHTLAGGVSLTPLFRDFERGLPRELAPYAALLAARTGTITGDLGKTAKFTVKLSFDDAAAAKRAAPVMDEGVKALAEKAAGFAAELKDSRRPAEAALSPLLAAAATGMKNAAVKADGATVVATAEIDAGPATAKAVADLLQSFTSHKKFVARSNNLKQIGLALHNYHDAMGSLPQNIYGPKGEPLLSWRVQLLPYLEQDNLYKQFKLDEPWDSENNKKLIAQMPKVFEVTGREGPKNQTYYQAFLTPDPQRQKPDGKYHGRSWLVEGGKVRMSLAQIPDGTSNTIGVVEARTSVVWSKPDDIPFGEKLPALGEEKSDAFMVLMLDGSVRTLRTDIKPDTLRILIDGQDGMVIPDDVFDDRPRRPGGGGPPPATPTRPATESKPPAAEKRPEAPEAQAELLRLEAQLAEALAVNKEMDAAHKKLVALAQQTAAAVRTGDATKADLEKAEAVVQASLVSVAESRKQIAELTDRIATAQRELERSKR